MRAEGPKIAARREAAAAEVAAAVRERLAVEAEEKEQLEALLRARRECRVPSPPRPIPKVSHRRYQQYRPVWRSRSLTRGGKTRVRDRLVSRGRHSMQALGGCLVDADTGFLPLSPLLVK
jgi:hypothetical protein